MWLVCSDFLFVILCPKTEPGSLDLPRLLQPRLGNLWPAVSGCHTLCSHGHMRIGCHNTGKQLQATLKWQKSSLLTAFSRYPLESDQHLFRDSIFVFVDFQRVIIMNKYNSLWGSGHKFHSKCSQVSTPPFILKGPHPKWHIGKDECCFSLLSTSL